MTVPEAILRRWGLLINSERSKKKAAVELIQRWYGGGSLPLDKHTETSVPIGWQEPESPVGAEDLYLNTVKYSCRICHVNQQTNSVSFRTFEEFFDNSSAIQKLVYESGEMPAAKRTFDNFWTSHDPEQYRTLLDFLNRNGRPEIAPLRVDALRSEVGFPSIRHLTVDASRGVSIHAFVSDEDGKIQQVSSADDGLTWLERSENELPFVALNGLAASSASDLSIGKVFALERKAGVPRVWVSSSANASSWTLVAGNGLPEMLSDFSLENKLFGSIHESETAYVAFDSNDTSLLNSGLYRTVNGGNSWGRISAKQAMFMVEDPILSDTVYLLSKVGESLIEVWEVVVGISETRLGVFPVSSTFGVELAVSRDESRRSVYVLFPIDDTLFRYDGEGENWVDLTDNLPRSTSMNSYQFRRIVVLPNYPERVFLSVFESYGIVGSSDRGESWTRLLNKDFEPKKGDKVVVPYRLQGHGSRAELFFIGWEYDSDGGFDLYRTRLPDFDFGGPGRPIAVGSALAKSITGQDVGLDASKSLFLSSYEWRVTSAPSGATVGVDYLLTGDDQVSASLSASMKGDYVVRLVTRSGLLESKAVFLAIEFEEENAKTEVSFKNEIMPLFVSCTSCHNGNNDVIYGRLDLSSNNENVVYSEVFSELSVRESKSRVDMANPAQSLILTQPANLNTPAHGGLLINGFNKDVGSSYKLLLRWLQEGSKNN